MYSFRIRFEQVVNSIASPKDQQSYIEYLKKNNDFTFLNINSISFFFVFYSRC